MRVCLVYDCLYPYTVGGAERWFRNVADELGRAGHEVTYVTRRQWDPASPPQIPGVRVVAVSPGGPLYTPSGRRTIRAPLAFAAGVLAFLARHRSEHDVVHMAAFPFFSLLAARAALLRARVALIVDWHEVWSANYWRTYLGPVGGRIGHAVQRLCVRATPAACVFSRLHRARLLEEGLRSEPALLVGEYKGPSRARVAGPAEPLAVFAGRHIPEKRVPLLVEAMALVHPRRPECRCVIFGDGPDRPRVLRLIDELRLSGVVEAPGFVDGAHVAGALSRAACMVLPSSREGYGLVVVEAAAVGTPSVVIRDEDNAAVELVEPDVNGLICEQPTPEDLAEAIATAIEHRNQLQVSTAEWFDRHAGELSVERSVEKLLGIYTSSVRR